MNTLILGMGANFPLRVGQGLVLIKEDTTRTPTVGGMHMVVASIFPTHVICIVTSGTFRQVSCAVQIYGAYLCVIIEWA